MLAAARSIYGELLSLGGDTSAARVELELALAAQIRIGPEDDRLLLKTRRRLAEVGEAAAAAFTAQLGPEHPHTKSAAETLANCLRQLGSPAPAAAAVAEPEPENGQ